MTRPRGPKPKPTHLKIVAGTDRPSRRNKREPMPDLARPVPPEELSTDAKVEWGRVADVLYRLGILTNLDRGILAAYCQAYGRWMQAERRLSEMAKIDTSGGGALMIATVSGNYIQNPLVGIANKAMADMAKYATDLGITPSARSRVQTTKPAGGAQTPAEKFGLK